MLANALPKDLPSLASFPFCATYNTFEAKFEVIALNSAIDGCIAAVTLAFVKYKFVPSAIFDVDNPGTLEIRSAVNVPVGEVIGLFVEFAVSITPPLPSVTTIVFAV